MELLRIAGVCAVATTLAGAPALAQSVISARSGLVHYVEGDVFLGDQKVDPKFGSFPDVKEKATLRTELGRAEVLLNPGVFLRLGENSSFRMVTNRLIDTRVEMLTGAAVVEADEIAKDTGVTIVCGNAAVALRKAGVFRFDMNPARLRVYAGEAAVEVDGKNVEVGAGKTLAFEGESAAIINKFDKEDTDALSRWSKRRGALLAMANVSAAKSMHDSGYSLYSSVWRWNPYFGMMTFIPARGTLFSPYGYNFWSPVTVGRVYYAPPPPSFGGGGWGGNAGYASMPQTSSGYSGTMASVGSSSSMGSSAPAAASNSGSTAASSAGTSSIGHGGGGGGGGRGR